MDYKNYNKWIEPLEFAQKISQNYDQDWVFLYSGLNHEIPNSKSVIALFLQENYQADNIDLLQEILNQNDNKKLFGYISYEAFSDIEKILKTEQNIIKNQKINLSEFKVIIEFDHNYKKITFFYNQHQLIDKITNWLNQPVIKNDQEINVKNIYSNFSNQSYIAAIQDIKNKIAQGEFYQVNLTRKFFGKLTQKFNDQTIFNNFVKLCQISPANYSSFLKIGEKNILSSSPELFIEINNNLIKSRPIKGTIARGENLQKDQDNKNYLANSVKEKAENLMIVDLVRNDLARICLSNSVKVDNLFAINSYKTLHHMSSEIYGSLKENITNFDILAATFPAGSMTGAPKIAAMNNIAENEKFQRGIYSGAIGFVSKNLSKLSVVIRTLIIEDDNFEFQVGGAITYDSDPNQELSEIFNKAKAINKILNLDDQCQIVN